MVYFKKFIVIDKTYCISYHQYVLLTITSLDRERDFNFDFSINTSRRLSKLTIILIKNCILFYNILRFRFYNYQQLFKKNC